MNSISDKYNNNTTLNNTYYSFDAGRYEITTLWYASATSGTEDSRATGFTAPLNKNFIAEPVVIACFNNLGADEITATINGGRLGLAAGVLCGTGSTTPSDVVPHYHQYTSADADVGDVD